MKVRLVILLIFFYLLYVGSVVNAQNIELDFSEGLESLRELLPKELELMKKSNTLLKQGKYEKAYQYELEYNIKNHGPMNPLVAVTLDKLVKLYRTQGQDDKAASLEIRSLAIKQEFFDDAPFVQSEWDALWAPNPFLDDLLNIAEQMVEVAKESPKSLFEDNKADPTNPSPLANLAELLSQFTKEESQQQQPNTQGQYAKLESQYQQSLAGSEKIFGAEHPLVARNLNILAMLHLSQGQAFKAEPLMQRALTILEKAHGPEHRDVATILNNLGQVKFSQGQHVKAKALIQRALTIREKTLGHEHPEVAKTLNDLSVYYYTLGQHVKVEPLLQRALAIWEKVHGPDHPDVATSLNNLGMYYRDQGQTVKAVGLIQRALTIEEKIFGPEHPNVTTSLTNLAGLYKDQGQYAKAESLYQRALAIEEKTIGPEHPNIAIYQQNLSKILWLLGGQHRMEQALELLQRSMKIREHYLRLFLARGSEQDKHDYMAARKMEMENNFIVSFHQKVREINLTKEGNKKAAYLAVTNILQRKGRILDVMNASVGVLRKRMNLEDNKLIDQLANMNSQRADLFNLAHQSKVTRKQYHSQKQKLEQQAQALEEKISKHSVEFLAQSQLVTLKNVQKAIPRDWALIEYFRYRPINPKKENTSLPATSPSFFDPKATQF